LESEAKKLFEDAQEMLRKIVSEKWLQANAVFGLFPANSIGDDIEIYADDSRSKVLGVQYSLRQQTTKAQGVPNHCLSRFHCT
jgi:5-methyltetrahydrofolate--homocysteine methyltransferase